MKIAKEFMKRTARNRFTNEPIKEMKENKSKYNNILTNLKNSKADKITTSNPIRYEINNILKYFNSKKNLGNIQKRETIIKFLEKNVIIINETIIKEEKNIRIPPKTSGNINKLSNNNQTSENLNSYFKQNV